jgi:hypothetical protein
MKNEDEERRVGKRRRGKKSQGGDKITKSAK